MNVCSVFYGIRAKKHRFSHFDEHGAAVTVCGERYDVWWNDSKKRRRKLKRRYRLRGTADLWVCNRCMGGGGLLFPIRR